jgi:hypothetical protein
MSSEPSPPRLPPQNSRGGERLCLAGDGGGPSYAEPGVPPDGGAEEERLGGSRHAEGVHRRRRAAAEGQGAAAAAAAAGAVGGTQCAVAGAGWRCDGANGGGGCGE